MRAILLRDVASELRAVALDELLQPRHGVGHPVCPRAVSAALTVAHGPHAVGELALRLDLGAKGLRPARQGAHVLQVSARLVVFVPFEFRFSQAASSAVVLSSLGDGPGQQLRPFLFASCKSKLHP